jgi:hypothetical protein
MPHAGTEGNRVNPKLCLTAIHQRDPGVPSGINLKLTILSDEDFFQAFLVRPRKYQYSTETFRIRVVSFYEDNSILRLSLTKLSRVNPT